MVVYFRAWSAETFEFMQTTTHLLGQLVVHHTHAGRSMLSLSGTV